MKKIIYLLFFICGMAQAQIVNIPDANFKAKLLEASASNGIAKDQNGIIIVIDTNDDNEIQVSEALNVYELFLEESGINDLTGIAAFTNLTDLHLYNNNLTELDVSALVNLEDLTCSNNNLTEVDLSNNPNIVSIWLLNNPLEYVNVKNGTAFPDSVIGTGSWMEWWGNLPEGCYVCADDFELQDIEDFLNLLEDGKHVSSYCTFYPGGDYNTVTGNVMFDVDNDGNCDNDATPHPYIRVDITDGTDQNSSFTDNDGMYVFYTQDGTYDLSLMIENASFFNITPSPANVTFPIVDNSIEVIDFCISPDGVHPDLEIVIAPIIPARPGFEATYKIVYRNKGNQMMSQTNGVNFYYQDQFVDFVSASETPDNQSDGVLSWDFDNLLPFEERSIEITMDVNTPTDPDFPVNIDDVLVYGGVIQPEAGDENVDDNTYNLHQTVVGAYDPNDITCLEGDVEDPENIGEQLHYLIRFENTGNFPAETVVVTMEIDPEQYSPQSLVLMNASHNVDARLVGNTAEFFFENIQLGSGGHGNILLAMQTLSSLIEGDEVISKADIYFDYNAPITTNDAATIFEETMSTQDPALDASIALYPNPAHGHTNISSPVKITSIEWYDISGRLVNINLVNGFEYKIDMSKKPVGVYFAKVHIEQGAIIKKVIKK